MSAPHSTKIIDEQARALLISEATPDELREKIAGFERKYQMTSDEFKIRWEHGDMPDTFETNLWATLLKHRANASKSG